MSFRIKKRYAHPILSEAALDEAGHEDGPVRSSRLRDTEQVVIPRVQQRIHLYETMIERMKARTKQLEKVLEWEIRTSQEKKEDNSLKPIDEPVWFV